MSGLAAWYAKQEEQANDFRAVVKVNGHEVATFAKPEEVPGGVVVVPAKHLKVGENVITTEMVGRGEMRVGVSAQSWRSKLPVDISRHDHALLSREFLHGRLSRNGVPLNAQSTSPVKNVELGQKIRVPLKFQNKMNREVIIVERIPDGFDYVKGSLSGGHSGARRDGRFLVVTYNGKTELTTVSYELIARRPGKWQFSATQMVPKNAIDQVAYGKSSALTILPKGVKSKDRYQYNLAERLVLAERQFADGEMTWRRRISSSFASGLSIFRCGWRS